MSRPSFRRLGLVAVLSALVAALSLPAAVAAAAPDVSLGTANVDGNAGEWDLGADFFASLHAGSDIGNPARADSYARYDCGSSTLFVLVLARAGEDIKTDEPGDHYVRIDGSGKLVSDLSGDDGNAPDFAFVGQSGTTADGWEASAILPPGTYDIRIFTKVHDDDTDGYDAILRDTEIGTECDPGTSDPHTIGFWKNWTSCDGRGNQSPVTDAVLASFASGGVYIGDLFVNTCDEAVKILSKRKLSGANAANDAAYGLAAQLLAARLNVQANAGTCAAVTTAINGGQALLDAIGFNGTGSFLVGQSANRTAALGFASTLDSFNNGNVC